MGGGLALILFLVFGGIFLGKRQSDKREHKHARNEYEQQRANDDDRLSDWLSVVTDRELEISLEDGLYNSDEKLIQEVRDSWHYYFGIEAPPFYSNDVDKYQSTNKWAYVSNHMIDRVIALRILMANRGRLTENDAQFGIKFSSTADTRRLEEDKHAINTRFFNAVNSRLKAHGIDKEMYASADNGSTFRLVEEIYSGVVYWRPMIRTASWNLSQLTLNGKTR